MSFVHGAPDLSSGVFASRSVAACFLRADSTLAAQDARDAFATPEAIGLVADRFIAAVSFLNRLAALKMMEARDIVQERVSACDSHGFNARGFEEFVSLAPGLIDHGGP